MPVVQQLTDHVRERVLERFALTEVGDPYDRFVRTSDGSVLGEVRVWTGDEVACVVDSRLTVPDLGIDSTMLHAFTPAGSPSPHLVSDLAGLPHGVNLHVDLVPRVDLATQPTYLDTVYPPLTDARGAAQEVTGARQVDVPPRLRAYSSPWLVGVTVPPDRLDEVEPVWTAYLDRFVELVAAPPTVDGSPDLAARDAASREGQFGAASDPVWDFLAGLVGRPSVERLLQVLHTSQP